MGESGSLFLVTSPLDHEIGSDDTFAVSPWPNPLEPVYFVVNGYSISNFDLDVSTLHPPSLLKVLSPAPLQPPLSLVVIASHSRLMAKGVS